MKEKKLSSIEKKLKRIGLEMQPYWSTKYLKNVEKLSKPLYKVKEEKDVWVPMRDGVKLSVDIYRPDVADKKFPAIVGWSPYNKFTQWGLREAPRERDVYDVSTAPETGDIDFFVKRGYVFMVPDPRGIGKSQGEWYGMFSAQEQEDCYDAIEWIAKRTFCDGNVSMSGVSYYGIIQNYVAILQPPHLKCIIPFPVFDDYYLRAWEGGAYPDYWSMLGHTSPNNAVSWSEKIYSEAELKRKIQERLKDPDIRNKEPYCNILNCWPPRLNTWFLDILLHPLDGPFWDSRRSSDNRDKIKIPVYGWTKLLAGAQPPVPYASGAFKQFADPRLKVPKKVSTYGIPVNLPYRWQREEQLRWYDHWLKGIDTGIMDEPPVRLFVHGVNKYRWENEWPLARTKWMKLYLRRYHKLEPEPIEDEFPPDILVHEPPLTSKMDQLHPLKYITEPLTMPLEVTGHPIVYLYAAIEAEYRDANFTAIIYDVSGASKTRINEGFSRASHRIIKENQEHYLTKPYVPLHDHTKSVPIKPEAINLFAIELKIMSNVFQTGHRIELEIASVDNIMGTKLPTSYLVIYKIFRDAKYPSHIMLPTIPETPSNLWIDTPPDRPFYPFSQR